MHVRSDSCMSGQMLLHLAAHCRLSNASGLSGSQAARSASMKEGEAERLMVQHQGAGPVPRDHRPVRQWMQKLSGYAGFLHAELGSLSSDSGT